MVQAEQAGQNLVVGQQPGPPVVTPAIGFGHRLVQCPVFVGEPCGPLVVEVGQGAGFEDLFRRSVFWQDAVGVAGDHFGHPDHLIGRVQPSFALFVQRGRGGGNLLRPRVGGIGGSGDIVVRPSGKGKVSKVVEGV